MCCSWLNNCSCWCNQLIMGFGSNMIPLAMNLNQFFNLVMDGQQIQWKLRRFLGSCLAMWVRIVIPMRKVFLRHFKTMDFESFQCFQLKNWMERMWYMLLEWLKMGYSTMLSAFKYLRCKHKWNWYCRSSRWWFLDLWLQIPCTFIIVLQSW